MLRSNYLNNLFSKTWFHFTLIILIALIGYSNSVQNDFLMDDHIDLFSPEGAAYKTLGTIFLKPQGDIYRPFTHFFCWVAYNIFGTNAAGYHLANLCLFALICLLFYLIVRVLTNNRALALLTGLLFCLHPINSTLVNYISAIQICFYILVTQLAFLFLVLSIQKNENRGLYYLSLVFYLFCLMSHEMSYFFPFIAASLMYFMHNYSFKKIILHSLPFFFMAFVYFIFRSIAYEIHAGNEGPVFMLPHLGLYFFSYVELISWYLSKLVIPKDILFLWSSHLDYKVMTYDDKMYLGTELGTYKYIAFQYLQLLLMIGAVIYLIFFRWKKGLKPFLLTVFTIGLLTVGYAGYVYFPGVKPIIEPHWFYFTSIGFFIFLAAGLLKLKTKTNMITWSLIVLLIFTGYYSSLRSHNSKWKDQETYCRYWLSLNDENMTPHYWLGKSLMKRGLYKEAAESIERGLASSFAADGRILADVGYAHIKSGNREEGLKRLQYALKIGGARYAPLHYYFGEYYLQENDLLSAATAYAVAADLDPHRKDFQVKLEFVKRALAARSNLQ